MLNAGFSHAIAYIQDPHGEYSHSLLPSGSVGLPDMSPDGQQGSGGKVIDALSGLTHANPNGGSGDGGYVSWAGIYAYFFSILIYTTTYLILVQKAFTLITYLPDKVLRWIGGGPEQFGDQAANWAEESKQKVGDAGKGMQDAQGQMSKQMGGHVQQKIISPIKKGIGNKLGGGGSVGMSEQPPMQNRLRRMRKVNS